MTEREVQQINQPESQPDGWLEGKPLPPKVAILLVISTLATMSLAPFEQGEDPGRDRCDSDQLSCVFNENEGGEGEGSWSIRGELDHVEAGWAIHDSGCDGINGGVIGDRLWQAVNLDYEFPGTKETVEVTDLSGEKTCVVPAGVFLKAVEDGSMVIEDEAEAEVAEEVNDEQLQQGEIKEEVLLEPEVVVVPEVPEKSKAELRRELLETAKNGLLNIIFNPETIVKGFCLYVGGLVIIVGGIGVYWLRGLLGSDSGGGGIKIKEPLSTAASRGYSRSKNSKSGVMRWFWE